MSDILPLPQVPAPRLHTPPDDPGPTAPALAQSLPVPRCRHCRRRAACKPRGLCGACYRDGDVRAQYPAGRSARRGQGLGRRRSRLPEPTAELPGTEAKVLVLIERARLRQDLWHPDDAEAA